MIRAIVSAMQRPMRLLALSLACVALTGCKRQPVPEGLDLLVAPIDTSISLADWMKRYPHDLAVFDAPAGSANEYICRTAEWPVPVAGATMTRYALFYIPDAPPGEVFPSDTVHFAGKECNLRATWAVREVNDSAVARTFADTLERALAARLGAGRDGAEIAGLGTGAWQHTKTWHTGTTRVVLGVEAATEYRSRKTGNVTKQRPRVIVAAYTPHSGLSPTSEGDSPSMYGQSHFFLRDADQKVESDWIDSTLALPGIPPSIVADLKRVLAHTRSEAASDSVHTLSLDSAMIRAVTTTRDSVKHLDGPARAATLFASDLVLNGYAGTLSADTTSADMPTHRRLRAAGVEYVDARGPTFVYTRPWLWDAYHADSLSPAGQMAFLDLLANGWSTKPDCADGRAGYDRIISHGEAALAAGQSDPLIHLLVGEAYRDIYSLAHGGGGDYANASDFTARAEPARRKAIEHLVLALKTLRQQPVRHAAWDDAIRLVLGAHTQTSFLCLY
jgi:hypothetical protein